ncbi:MAG TPA: alpha-galactosidase, partial [Lachnospiraceae bacterium]|nr:alpha-galactosidase [Lachnospiraceae bacterium]
EGTALVYPLSAMGAHVSDCPNHTVGRSVPFETRGYAALAGTFGYELDVTKISEEERGMIRRQVSLYHQYNDIIRSGDYYRIASYRENHFFDCFAVVKKDRSEAVITFIQVLARPNVHSKKIRLKGLKPEAEYRVSCDKNIFCASETEEKSGILTLHGDTLMNAGIHIGGLSGDFAGAVIHAVEI